MKKFYLMCFFISILILSGCSNNKFELIDKTNEAMHYGTSSDYYIATNIYDFNESKMNITHQLLAFYNDDTVRLQGDEGIDTLGSGISLSISNMKLNIKSNTSEISSYTFYDKQKISKNLYEGERISSFEYKFKSKLDTKTSSLQYEIEFLNPDKKHEIELEFIYDLNIGGKKLTNQVHSISIPASEEELRENMTTDD